MTGSLAVAFAADRYRYKFGSRIDAATLGRWTGFSRATCYRCVRKLNEFFDEDGDLKKGIFKELGGDVRVRPTDVLALGPNGAIVLALLRRWDRHPKAVKARNGAVEVIAGELGLAAGRHDRTIRRILERLSTGNHRKGKVAPKKPYLGRIEISQHRGRASFIRVTTLSEQRDFTNRAMAKPRVAPAAPSSEQAAATRAKQQDPPRDPASADFLETVVAQLKGTKAAQNSL